MDDEHAVSLWQEWMELVEVFPEVMWQPYDPIHWAGLQYVQHSIDEELGVGAALCDIEQFAMYGA